MKCNERNECSLCKYSKRLDSQTEIDRLCARVRGRVRAVYDWQATKRHPEIGTFKFAIREDVELDVEYEHLATLRHPDGASVRTCI